MIWSGLVIKVSLAAVGNGGGTASEWTVYLIVQAGGPLIFELIS